MHSNSRRLNHIHQRVHGTPHQPLPPTRASASYPSSALSFLHLTHRRIPQVRASVRPCVPLFPFMLSCRRATRRNRHHHTTTPPHRRRQLGSTATRQHGSTAARQHGSTAARQHGRNATNNECNDAATNNECNEQRRQTTTKANNNTTTQQHKAQPTITTGNSLYGERCQTEMK